MRLVGVAKHLHGARIVCAADNRNNGQSECDARLPIALSDASQLPSLASDGTGALVPQSPPSVGLDTRVLALNVLGVHSPNKLLCEYYSIFQHVEDEQYNTSLIPLKCINNSVCLALIYCERVETILHTVRPTIVYE